MTLHEAIKFNNWKEFLRQIEGGVDPCQLDEQGETVLHCLARKHDDNSAMSKMFSRTVTDYFVEINARTRSFGTATGDLALVQNRELETAVHVAIASDNWSLAIHLGRQIGYFANNNAYRRNRHGLTEFDLAVLLYGIHSRRNEMESVFGYKGSVARELASVMDGLFIIKSIAKGFKLVKRRTHVFMVDHEHELFSKAEEEAYPSPYSTFEDAQLLSLLENPVALRK